MVRWAKRIDEVLVKTGMVHKQRMLRHGLTREQGKVSVSNENRTVAWSAGELWLSVCVCGGGGREKRRHQLKHSHIYANLMRA